MSKKSIISTKDVKVKSVLKPKSGGIITTSSSGVHERAAALARNRGDRRKKEKMIVSGPENQPKGFDWKKLEDAVNAKLKPKVGAKK